MIIKTKRIPIKEIILYGFWPSFLKKIIYFFKGYKISKGVKIGFGTVIIGENVNLKFKANIGSFSVIIADSIEIGEYSTVGSFTYINTLKFTLGIDSKIRENVYIGGAIFPDSQLLIGNRSSIGQGCFINPSRSIKIGDDTAIGGNGLIFTHASWQSILDGYPVKYEPVVIEDNVYIAWRVFILPGITIGKNSTIGADSTVTISVPSNSLASGSPLKIVLSGENNWPRKISVKAKLNIIEEINNNFVQYLEVYKYKTTLTRNEDVDVIQVEKIKGKVYCYKRSYRIEKMEANNTFLFYEKCPIDKVKNQKIVILDLQSRKRIGSNDLGEEYIRFLSRYGIRFERVLFKN